MYEESFPATLLGGPHDGMEVDVTDSTDEVRRPTERGNLARYFRIQRHLLQFIGYEDAAQKRAGN